MPTGVALRDAREQLFDAAERILLRDGPSALTSRSVTAEAGCAKGVLHRHFSDFDAFLAELVHDRARRIHAQAQELRAHAGTGSVVENIADALMTVFESVAVAILALITFRDDLRARLRETWPRGVPLANDAVAMVAGYLEAEREQARVAADADIPVLAPTVAGACQLLLSDRKGTAPELDDVRRTVATVIGGVLTGRRADRNPPTDPDPDPDSPPTHVYE